MEFGKAERMKTVQDVIRQTRKYARRLPIQDIISIVCVSTILPIGYLIQVTYVLCFWFELFSDQWLIRVVPLTLVALNVYLNLVHVFMVGPNGPGTQLPTVQKPGYRFCHACQLNSPPRAYHCPTCDTCILRRDHHCSFAGVCVGHFNQRYFIAAIANLWLVLLVCVDWNASFAYASVPQLHSATTIWQVMIPHLSLIMGYLNLHQFVTVAFAVSSFTAFLFVNYLLSAQLFCILRGQTRVEYLLDIHAYNLGFWANLELAMGKHFVLALLSPLLPSPLPSDGVSFRVFDSDDVSKTTKYL